MTVKELTERTKLAATALPRPDEEIIGAYTGDLLSNVMCHMRCGNAWITVMTNANIVAVAVACGASCIIIAEGDIPDAKVLRLADEHGVNILSTEMTAYECAVRLSALGI